MSVDLYLRNDCRLLETTMLKKYGPAELAEHYAEFDTICDATQVIDLLLVGLNKFDFLTLYHYHIP